MPRPFLPPTGAHASAIAFLVLLFALYGNLMPLGAWGYVLGAGIGGAWGLLLTALAGWLERDAKRGAKAADASLLVAMAGLAAVAAAGMLYMLVFGAVLGQETATYAVLSAMMGPTVPYFIVLNGVLEMLVVPLALALNLGAGRMRGLLVGLAGLIYWSMRAWTYAVFAEPRVSMSTATLSDADVAWFRETIATDYRVYLAMLAALLLLVAALQRDLRRSAAG